MKMNGFTMMTIIIGFVLIQGSLALTPELREYFLKRHNDYRSNLALGKVKNKAGVEPSVLPKASNMYELKYNLEVEKIAQQWADNCLLQHKVINHTTNNLFAESPLKPFDVMGQKAMDAWTNESNVHGIISLNFTDEVVEKVGHWFEVNWHDVLEIGCGITNCNNGLGQGNPGSWTFVVCEYSPGGNYLNELVYTPGEPGSKCTHPNSKFNKATGLCYIDEPHASSTTTKKLSVETSKTSKLTPLSTAIKAKTTKKQSSTTSHSKVSTTSQTKASKSSTTRSTQSSKSTTIHFKASKQTTRAHRKLTTISSSSM